MRRRASKNGASRALHGYLTRDGIDPHELLRIGREELHRFASRDVMFAIVAAAEGAKAAVAINTTARKGLTAEPAATPA